MAVEATSWAQVELRKDGIAPSTSVSRDWSMILAHSLVNRSLGVV
jgi:hypothetical protein